MTDKLQTLRQNRHNFLINPPRDVVTVVRPVRDQYAVEGARFTFFNEFLSASSLGFEDVGESGNLRPCVVGAVKQLSVPGFRHEVREFSLL
jgi:hypothetical protein